jgi:hypothetical protein
VLTEGRDRQRDRELVLVAVQGRDLDPPVDQRTRPGLKEATQPRLVARAIAGRDDQVAQQRPDRDLPRPPERPLSLPIPRAHNAVFVDRYEGLVRRLKHLGDLKLLVRALESVSHLVSRSRVVDALLAPTRPGRGFKPCAARASASRDRASGKPCNVPGSATCTGRASADERR